MQQIGVEKILDPSRRARDAAGVDSVIDVVEAMINPFGHNIQKDSSPLRRIISSEHYVYVQFMYTLFRESFYLWVI